MQKKLLCTVSRCFLLANFPFSSILSPSFTLARFLSYSIILRIIRATRKSHEIFPKSPAFPNPPATFIGTWGYRLRTLTVLSTQWFLIWKMVGTLKASKNWRPLSAWKNAENDLTETKNRLYSGKVHFFLAKHLHISKVFCNFAPEMETYLKKKLI